MFKMICVSMERHWLSSFIPLAALFFLQYWEQNADNSQQNASRERLFIRRIALFAILCCGFVAAT